MLASTTPFHAQSTETKCLLDTFLDMVRIDSPSGQEDALRAYLVQRFEEKGLSTLSDAVGNLIVEIPALGCAHERRLVFSGHMDVVPPCLGIQPVLETRTLPNGDTDTVIYSDNSTVLGADDKSGLAPILEAVFFAVAHQWPRPALRLIFTVEEETGLAGAKGLEDPWLRDADFAVTLDHTGPQGVIIHEAPTYILLEIECFGVSCHAGMEPEKGVSAIVLASRIITRLNLGRLDGNTTANIGQIHGGKADNVVPDRVSLSGELRGHDPQRLETELAWIKQVLREESAALPGSRAELTTSISFKGYAITQEHPGIRRVSQAAIESGLEPICIRSNGGSDNNVFVERGLPGVVLSAGYVNPHALSEHVSLHEMTVCSRFLLNVLKQFSF